MDHVGIVVDDLAAAVKFFAELGLMQQREMSVKAARSIASTAVRGVRADTAMMQAPDGSGRLQLVKYHLPLSPRGKPTRRRTLRVSATSRSSSRTSTPSSPPCVPVALN
jgi:hypothetical protein